MMAIIITFLLPYFYILFNKKLCFLIIYLILYGISFYIASDSIIKKVFNKLLDKSININLDLKLSIIYLFLLTSISFLVYNYPIFLSFLIVVIIYLTNIVLKKIFSKYLKENPGITNYLKECYFERDTALNKDTANIRINSFKTYLKRYNRSLVKRLFAYSIIYLINFIYLVLIIYLIKDFSVKDIILVLYMSIYSYLFIKYVRYIKGYVKEFKDKKIHELKPIKDYKKITFKNVNIPNTISNFNLTINKSDKIYIVIEDKDYAPLLNTLLHESNYLGKISIDRKDIKDIDLSSVLMLDYSKLWFKETTLIDNILYNKILNSKNFHKLVSDYLPKNFIDSFVNEEGTTIKNVYNYPIYYQRLITLLRSINTDKELIILDKPFNNLSKYNQKIIEKELIKLDKSIIILSDTPPTLDNYDNILLLENLVVKEKGTYEELIKAKRDFYRLVNR